MNPFVIILICVATAGFFTWLLYSTQNPWSKSVNYILSAVRFIAIALLVWMLLAPEQKQNTAFSEKPIFVFAIDNSKSVASNASSKQQTNLKSKIANTAQQLQKNGFDVKFTDLKSYKNIDSITTLKFNQRATDLSGVLNNIRTEFDGQNLAGTLLVSDGIFNLGSSPLYENYTFPIYTLGFGDTIKRQDLAIKTVKYNRIVTSGNNFPIVAEIKNIGFSNQNIEVKLIQNKQIIATKTIKFATNESIKEVDFLAKATNDKIVHYTIEISPIKNENTFKNNIQHIYIEVIDSKTEILIIAAAPHPDLKALQAALSQNQEYATTLFIPEISIWPDKKYDLVIFHQIPNSIGIGNNYIEKIKKLEIPQWYFVGNQTNIGLLPQALNGFRIMSSFQQDKVQGDFAASFEKFSFEQDLKPRFASFPPLLVPFGEYNMPSWETILVQKVGNVITNKPVLSVNTSQNPSQAVWIGEGLWQWRMIENATNSNTAAFDQLILKTSQLLVSKKDKRKFRFSPVIPQFDSNQPTQFETECLNDVFEKIAGNEISLTLTHESKKKYDFMFTNTNSNPVFETNGLPQGVYTFYSKTKINNKEEIAQGSFSISETDFEYINTQADFELLKKLSESTNAKYFDINSITNFKDNILKSKKSDILHYIENYQEVINFKILFLLLFLLLFSEWVCRKYLGKQ